MKILKAIKKIFKLIIKTKLIILIVLISTPYKAIANIYEIKCEDNNISTGNNNMAMTIVYTFKKDLTIITSMGPGGKSKTKIGFRMTQKTNNSFKSEGLMFKNKTSLTYDGRANQLNILSDVSDNITLKCKKPKLLKEE